MAKKRQNNKAVARERRGENKKIKKVFKKALTNESESDIIIKLSQGKTVLYIEKWTKLIE